MNKLFFRKFDLIRVVKTCCTRRMSHAQNDMIIEYLKQTFAEFHKPNHFEYLATKDANLKKCRNAAVLVPISASLEKNAANHFVQKSFLTLSKRTEKMSNHKGQVCFVGGMSDPGDKDLVHTAFREAKEEIGIEPSQLTFLAQLCPLITSARTLVTPIVCFFDHQDYKPNLNLDEVELVFNLPSERFISNFNHEHKSFKTKDNDEYYVHYFKDMVGDREIKTWGVTAIISIVVGSILHSRPPSFVVDPKFPLKSDNVNEFMEYTVLKHSESITRYLEKTK